MSKRSHERIGAFGTTPAPGAVVASYCRGGWPAPGRLRVFSSSWHRSLRNTRGFSAVMTTIGLTVFIGMGAMSVDVGRMIYAGQLAQDVADAAAFAGGPLLRVPADAIVASQQAITANNAHTGGFQVACQYIPENTASDILYYAPGSTVPGYGVLGLYAKALRVKTHVTVPYTFGRVLGLTNKNIMRQATVIRAPVGGCPIAPLWISHPTEYRYGEYQNLLMRTDPEFTDIPGNFGWLALPPDVSASWADVLSGVGLSDSDMEALFVDVGDNVTGYPGLSTGQWVQGLESRIERALAGPWAAETWETCTPTNPRIIIIPLVDYVSGTGSGATYQILRFGAFWLEQANASGNPKSIDGRFIRYTLPGAGIEPLASDVGLFSYRLAG